MFGDNSRKMYMAKNVHELLNNYHQKNTRPGLATKEFGWEKKDTNLYGFCFTNFRMETMLKVQVRGCT